MRIMIRPTIRLDVISTKNQVATAAGYASTLGYDLTSRKSSQRDGEIELILSARDSQFSDTALAGQVLYAALAGDETPRKVVEGVIRTLERSGLDVDQAVPRFTQQGDPE